MRIVKVSAPGKIHLIGEHAVVYGQPAIIAAVGLRTHIKLVPNSETRFPQGEQELKALATRVILEKLNLKIDFTLTERLEIPSGAGLGSSASFAVALAAGISQLAELDLSLAEINELAFLVEQAAADKVSGGDNTASTYGGLIYFQKPDIIHPLVDEIPELPEGFILVNTGKPQKTTGELLKIVADLPAGTRNQNINAIGELVDPLLSAIKDNNQANLIEIINTTHTHLHNLGVSTPTLDKLHARIKAIGGGAKLCGAGGGGVMLCFHQDTENLKQVIAEMGYEATQAKLGDEGVRWRIENPT